MYNLDAIFQSFTDVWQPVSSLFGVILVLAIVVFIYKKRKNHNS